MYKKESPSGNKTGPITANRIQNVESTLRLMKEVSEDSAEFYELEPLEVLFDLWSISSFILSSDGISTILSSFSIFSP